MINFSLNTCWRLIPTGNETESQDSVSFWFIRGPKVSEPKAASSRQETRQSRKIPSRFGLYEGRRSLSQRPHHPDRKRDRVARFRLVLVYEGRAEGTQLCYSACS